MGERTTVRIVNVVELFAGHERDDVAFVCGEAHQTYGGLSGQMTLARTQLLSRYSVGDTVLILGESSIAFIETLFAALSAGISVVPMHPRYPRGEIERAIELARPVAVISTDSASATLASAVSAPHVIGSELFGPPSGDVAAPVDCEPDHPALLMFTSGTASSPRIAVLSHRNIAASIRQSIASAPMISDGPHTTLGVMPLTHVLGIVSVVAVAVAVGATVVLVPDVDVGSVAAAVAANKVTLLVAPPVFWYRLSTSDVDAGSMASVRLALSGSAPLSGSVAVALNDRYSLKLRQGYGLTEASPGLTSAVGTEAPATSVGRPLPGVTLRLVDEFGDDALVGDVGEIWARGDNVFAGYLHDEDATAEVVDSDGWLHTGDLAVVDESGFLFIVGRNKDQIIVSGFNVHPSEVEERLVGHHSVEAAAVVGEPDREYGEVVVAYVVAAPGALVEADVLEAHCRTRLAGYKVPGRFEVVEELPRGATGKIRRRALRAPAGL